MKENNIAGQKYAWTRRGSMGSPGRPTLVHDPLTREWVTPEEYARRKAERYVPQEKGPFLDINWPRKNEAVAMEKKPDGKFYVREFQSRRQMKQYYRENGLVEAGG